MEDHFRAEREMTREAIQRGATSVSIEGGSVSDLDAAIGTPRETSAKLDHTLRAYGRLEVRHYEVKRDRARLAEWIEENVDGAQVVRDTSGHWYVVT